MAWEIDPSWVVGGFSSMFAALVLVCTKAFGYLVEQRKLDALDRETEKAAREKERVEFFKRLDECQEKHHVKDIEYAKLEGKVSILGSMNALPQMITTAVLAGLNKELTP